MNRACAAHDFIRIVPLQGGEPFLHPDFPKIIAHALLQKNVGMVQIFSNMVCDISYNLEVLQVPRVHLRISNYTNEMNRKQKALFYRNIEMISARDIPHTIISPDWQLAPTLLKRDCSIAQMTRIKQSCPCPPDSRLIINGVYYPCHYAAYIRLHGVADYPEDKVTLDQFEYDEELRLRIAAVNERPYYDSCAHCDFSDTDIPPAEQGFDARYRYIGQDFISLVPDSPVVPDAEQLSR
jgi:MoaA/NifB/PqqE/SkfB family radical SAM enzyme